MSSVPPAYPSCSFVPMHNKTWCKILRDFSYMHLVQLSPCTVKSDVAGVWSRGLFYQLGASWDNTGEKHFSKLFKTTLTAASVILPLGMEEL